VYEIAIVGGGPAGASAAIFTAKAGVRTLLIDNGRSVTRRAWIRNHYGLPEITGPELVDRGKQQAAALGADVVTADVRDIRRDGEGFVLETDAGTFTARRVILATGPSTDLAERIGVHLVPGREPRIRMVAAVDPDGRTNIEGIWACGTVAGVSVHTIVTSGDGARVAINVLSEMNGARYVDHDVLPRDAAT
jgi:thioredoxin reductase (NADPH)